MNIFTFTHLFGKNTLYQHEISTFTHPLYTLTLRAFKLGNVLQIGTYPFILFYELAMQVPIKVGAISIDEATAEATNT